MFELENQIAAWRHEMCDAGIKRAEVLDELEGHLREDIADHTRAGMNSQEAFEMAVENIGSSGLLKKEFKKVAGLKAVADWMKQFIFTLAGIPNYQLATNMNTSNPNANLEPAWATYLKAGVFLLPAVSLWVLSNIFLLPMLRLMHLRSGGNDFSALLSAISLLGVYGVWLGCAIFAAFAALEWRAAKWPRYRKAVVGVGTFAINTTVLVISFAMFFLAGSRRRICITQ